ncbi:MAG: chemotaxis protein CheW [Terriglobales bacterium]
MEEGNILEMPAPDEGRETATENPAESGAITAQEIPAEQPPERQYCVLKAGGHCYCMSVLEIEEVVEWPIITPVPMAPAHLAGIFNLRGAIVPVVDLAANQARRDVSTSKRVVVGFMPATGSHGFIRIGIAADEVIGTHTTVAQPITEGISANVPHCRGLIPIGDQQALVLDLKRVVEHFPIPLV